MTVPERFVGIWRRTGLGIEDGPVARDGDVFWLQAEECFADLRSGGSERRGFAGRASWAAPEMTWTAEVTAPAPAGPELPDVGALAGDGDLLVERGTWMRDGRAERYVERWERTGPRGPVVALRRGPDRFLSIGGAGGDGAAVLVTPGGGRRWVSDGGGWVVASTVGAVVDDVPPVSGEGWVTWT